MAKRKGPPASTEEGREAQLIALSVDETERRILDGSAPSQLLIHYLKLGSSREKLEQAKLLRETQLLNAKAETMGSQARVEELMTKALDAMRTYTGASNDIEDFDVED